MSRFIYTKQKPSISTFGISIIIFMLIIGLFYFAFSSFSQKTYLEQKATLEKSLQQSIIHCYCVEGSYPESLDYLKDNYGISYNKDKFFVDYKPLGQDIMPDLTIIVKADIQNPLATYLMRLKSPSN
ncbi:MAG: hypothetical protein RR275_00155 [Lachnospiraceae bacterium]